MNAADRVLAEYESRFPGNRSAANFDFMMRDVLLRDVELEGRRLLDVGCGLGFMGLWAAGHGASMVGLEPEAAGSEAARDAKEQFDENAAKVGLSDRAELLPLTLAEYAASADARFDVILMAASINHLDEDACMRLHEDEQARAAYREHLRTVAELAAPGATLVVSDVARRNLFQRLGRRNPLAPTIEWDKHQQPELWAELLSDVGFTAPRIRWASLNSLRRPGQVLLGNRVAAYAMQSGFVLQMRRAEG